MFPAIGYPPSSILALTPAARSFGHFQKLDPALQTVHSTLAAGGVLVSTWKTRQRRHAEDGSWASLIIGPNKTANEELALAA